MKNEDGEDLHRNHDHRTGSTKERRICCSLNIYKEKIKDFR